MTERTFYQQLVQEQPLDPEELFASLAAIWERATTH